MKKKILLIIAILYTTISFSQECLTDQYLDALSSKDVRIKESVKTRIKNLVTKRKLQQKGQSDKIITIPVVFNTNLTIIYV